MPFKYFHTENPWLVFLYCFSSGSECTQPGPASPFHFGPLVSTWEQLTWVTPKGTVSVLSHSKQPANLSATEFLLCSTVRPGQTDRLPWHRCPGFSNPTSQPSVISWTNTNNCKNTNTDCKLWLALQKGTLGSDPFAVLHASIIPHSRWHPPHPWCPRSSVST